MRSTYNPTAITASPALSPIRRHRTTAEEVEDQLILAIAKGYKKPGERLTEAEISCALEVSRIPAREAMQKLQLRGVLVESGLRGLRVADYSPERIAELIELRFAIERIFFLRVFRSDYDRGPLLTTLEKIIEEMKALSEADDGVTLASIDLEFHRTIAVHAGNELAIQVWEGLAQHLLIVFCHDWLSGTVTGRGEEVNQHRKLVEYLRIGKPERVDEILREHYGTFFSEDGL